MKHLIPFRLESGDTQFSHHSRPGPQLPCQMLHGGPGCDKSEELRAYTESISKTGADSTFLYLPDGYVRPDKAVAHWLLPYTTLGDEVGEVPRR